MSLGVSVVEREEDMADMRKIRAEALKSLNPEQQLVLNARTPRSGRPLSWKKIADQLGISVGRAQTLCDQAQEDLARAIAKGTPDMPATGRVDPLIAALFESSHTGSRQGNDFLRAQNEYHGGYTE